MLGPRKPPTSSPAGRDHPSGEREADADVELPERAPDAARHRELEPGDRAARAHDACQLAQRRRRILDVAQEVRERQCVEARVRERQLFGAALDERDRLPAAGGALPPASPGSGRARPPCSPCARRSSRATAPVPVATSSTVSCGPAVDARDEETAASGGPGRTRAARRSGRTSARAGRRASARRRPLPRGRVYAWRGGAERRRRQDRRGRVARFAAPGEELAAVLRGRAGARRTRLPLRVCEAADGDAELARRSTTRAARDEPQASPRRGVDRRARRDRGGERGGAAGRRASCRVAVVSRCPRRDRGWRRRSVALQSALPAVEELTRDIEGNYKLELT